MERRAQLWFLPSGSYFSAIMNAPYIGRIMYALIWRNGQASNIA